MHKLSLKANHKPVLAYYEALGKFQHLGISHETAVRSAFQTLLEACCRQFSWTLVPEWEIKRPKLRPVRVDGALVDAFRLAHGYWEAKDEHDDLAKEVKKKFAVGYPKDNILFQAPERAILYQNGRQVLDEDISKPDRLVETLSLFVEYLPPAYEQWEDAVGHFQTEVPKLAEAVKGLIERERKTNPRFIQAFADFYQLCRDSINPNLSELAVEEMLIQHLLTERIFRTVFHNPDFTRRNVIAVEIEKVINAMTSRAFSRDAFLKSLDHFYKAIETTASTIDDYSQKQHFLNAVYEKFFQGFSIKVADTHGIVYTPQPIVNFMVRSVEDILQKEFGKSLSSRDVHILDPFVGTGNFMVRVMQEIKRTALRQKYKDELHCNEVMLLPYYIASMNIEHEHFEATGSYEPFEGICFVDTFELAEAHQAAFSFMTVENTRRVERQKRSPITVIIGNPPYNVGQLNENDNNKNRKYKVMDKRVSETYAKDSKASLLSHLSDPYVKAIRWASDRIGDDGIIAFVTNNSFLAQIAFDGMRKHLENDFSEIRVLDLGGNVRRNPKLSGTTHNVFGIQVGVSINFFIRRQTPQKEPARIYYAQLEESWRKEQKYRYLEEQQQASTVNWQAVEPNPSHTWLSEGLRADFDYFVPLGTKEGKALKEQDTIFKAFGHGCKTGRDAIVYNFSKSVLLSNVERFCDSYNAEVNRYLQKGKPKDLDNFLSYDAVKWSRNLKRGLLNQRIIEFDESKVRTGMFRAFAKAYQYFDDLLIDELGKSTSFFPTPLTEKENQLICVPGVGGRTSYWCYCTNLIPASTLTSVDMNQCFPFYTYDEDGSNRRENITDWALTEYRSHYEDNSITKWDIFYYTYAVLHHPAYRARYAANLKRELPRIPYAPDFHAFAQAGRQLAGLHVDYEKQPEYPLDMIENPEAPLDWRVEKMRLSKDKTRIVYNDFLTLAGIPAAAFEYRLGNRSALDWVIDQYQVSTDKRSGITNDPNRADDPQYIFRLIGQVIMVSLETMKIVHALPDFMK
ncbi:MAG: type ISP restriction/modification enzyme [Blastocatellia bacterium]